MDDYLPHLGRVPMMAPLFEPQPPKPLDYASIMNSRSETVRVDMDQVLAPARERARRIRAELDAMNGGPRRR